MGITSQFRLSSLVCPHTPLRFARRFPRGQRKSVLSRPPSPPTRSTCSPSPFCSSSRSAPMLPSTTTTSPPTVAMCTTRNRVTPTSPDRRTSPTSPDRLTSSPTSPVTRDPLVGRGCPKRNCEAFLNQSRRWQLLGVCRLGKGSAAKIVKYVFHLSVAIASPVAFC